MVWDALSPSSGLVVRPGVSNVGVCFEISVSDATFAEGQSSIPDGSKCDKNVDGRPKMTKNVIFFRQEQHKIRLAHIDTNGIHYGNQNRRGNPALVTVAMAAVPATVTTKDGEIRRWLP